MRAFRPDRRAEAASRAYRVAERCGGCSMGLRRDFMWALHARLVVEAHVGPEAVVCGPDYSAPSGVAWRLSGPSTAGLSRTRTARPGGRKTASPPFLHAQLHHDVVRAVQRNYFDSMPVLFPGDAVAMAACLTQAEILAEEYNAFIRGAYSRPREDQPLDAKGSQAESTKHQDQPAEKEPGPQDTPVAADTTQNDLLPDLVALRRAVRLNLRRELAFLTRMAKAETLAQLNRRNEAAELALQAYNTKSAIVDA